jgi:glycosyltransferase involved in cell wall biosynthesis
MVTNNLTISIVLATYNGEKYLAAQLASLRNQTLTPFELIVADDHSSDETVKIINDFSKTCDFPVRLTINQVRKGYDENFMSVMDQCRGDLIAFCDQDDVWLPEKLARMQVCFSDPQILLAYHNAQVTDRDLNPLRRLYDPQSQQKIVETQPMHPWHISHGFAQVFRSWLRRHDGSWAGSIDHNRARRMAHDQWYCFLAGLYGGVAHVDEDLAFYRQHGNNVAGAKPVPTMRKRLDAFLSHSSAWEHQAGASAQFRAEFARQLLQGAASWHRPQLQLCETAYKNLAARLTRRALFYDDKKRRHRLKSLAQAIFRGDYSRDRLWKFAWQSLPRDMVLGVLNKSPQTAGQPDSAEAAALPH